MSLVWDIQQTIMGVLVRCPHMFVCVNYMSLKWEMWAWSLAMWPSEAFFCKAFFLANQKRRKTDTMLWFEIGICDQIKCEFFILYEVTVLLQIHDSIFNVFIWKYLNIMKYLHVEFTQLDFTAYTSTVTGDAFVWVWLRHAKKATDTHKNKNI